MGDKTEIEWTDATWNPVTGCSKVSPGCAHCYAEVIAERFRGTPAFPSGFDIVTHPDRLEMPLRWKRPRRIFVNSMSDLFHDEVPDDFIKAVFSIMERATWHEFQLLTKRSGRLRDLARDLPWPSNVWMGVSVENQWWTSRISDLRDVPAAIRFLSVEPLLGPLQLNLAGIDWVIVGGESGRGSRPMHLNWALSVRDQCQAANVAFFFKQWGSHDANGVRQSKRSNGRMLQGRTWDAMPRSHALSGGGAWHSR